MSRARMKQDQQFWAIVQDLRWKLDDGTARYPSGEPEFSHAAARGGRFNVRSWSTHLLAFGLGVFALGVALLVTSL